MVRQHNENSIEDESRQAIYDFARDNKKLSFNYGDRKKLVTTLIDFSRLNPDVFSYTINDINADGNDELIISFSEDSMIALFTQVKGKTVLLDSFSERYHAQLCDSGRILIKSSGGAFTALYQLCEINESGDSLDVVGKIGIDVKTVNDNNVVYYYFGEEKEEISEELFYRILDSFKKGRNDEIINY